MIITTQDIFPAVGFITFGVMLSHTYISFDYGTITLAHRIRRQCIFVTIVPTTVGKYYVISSYYIDHSITRIGEHDSEESSSDNTSITEDARIDYA